MLEPQKIPLIEIIRKFKREGIENFVITRPEIVETLLTAYEKEKEKNKELNRLKGFEMLDIFNMGKQSSRQRIEFDYVDKEKIKERIKEYYEYDKRMQNKPDWHTTKYYEAKALEKLLEE